ncbi:MAG: hypothetical protein HS111_25060 [Kofleriaceae bacterium]|nr:hypothetical protein [Kofleriaceae bacterium]
MPLVSRRRRRWWWRRWRRWRGGGAGGAAQGEACPDRRCAAGLACVEDYGSDGPIGPTVTACEVRCGKGGRCPDGQSCITIADGPGEVCRPADDR